MFAVVLSLVYSILVANQQQQAALNHQLLVAQPVKQLERFIDELDDVAFKAMPNQSLISLFTALRDEKDLGNYFSQDVMVDIETASLLTGLNRGISPV